MQAEHHQEVANLKRQLRADLSDDEYDRHLYASGKNNRVWARDVFKNSCADEAGLKRGDDIVRYDDVWIFKPGDLLLASARGEHGEPVALRIPRDGQPCTIYIRRGPLGVILNHRRGDPRLD